MVMNITVSGFERDNCYLNKIVSVSSIRGTAITGNVCIVQDGASTSLHILFVYWGLKG